ncbi:hypothetical protein E6C70_00775 [Glaciibacter flavus]|uniref:Uncharacterized protein n=1 Tax=Orlajensenia flava TaxID=2565934 RepID=A0A4S4G0F3_9MICO|nr:hypothetical protein [Glaciibacter flavus]THG36111.1 hypothetical protein E6C70_00775 [Glaciibacter flavus]
MRMIARAAMIGTLSAFTLALAGCTPSATGYAGLYLDDSNELYGVVHACRSAVTTFTATRSTETAETIGSWSLPNSAGATSMVPLGTRADVAHLIGDQSAAGFAASTPGEADATLVSWVSGERVAALRAGQLLYAAMNSDGTDDDVTDYDGFTKLSCAAFF